MNYAKGQQVEVFNKHGELWFTGLIEHIDAHGWLLIADDEDGWRTSINPENNKVVIQQRKDSK